MLLGKSEFGCKAPLILSGIESGGLMVEAMAVVFRAATVPVNSFDLELNVDSILETVWERQTLAKDG